MNKKLVILLGTFICLGTCFNIRQAAMDLLSTSEKHPIMNTYATSNGVVPITNKNGVFSIQVDLLDYHSHANDMTYGPATADMMIQINSALTVLTKGCIDFADYDAKNRCNIAQCPSARYNDNNVFSLPFLSFPQELIYLRLTVDYTYWQLQNDALLAYQGCTSGLSTFGAGTIGLIGLGYNSYNYIYKSADGFSLYLYPDNTGGYLDFQTSTKYMDSSVEVARILCDSSNWTTQMFDIFLGDNSMNDNTMMVILDLNTDAIGVPIDSYNRIMDMLGTYLNTCTGIDLVTCSNTIPIDNFPVLELRKQSSDNEIIPIPPALYLKPAVNQTGRVTLGIRGISSTGVDASYVTPAYDGNCIILGRNVLIYYYTTYSHRDSAIRFYKATSTPPPKVQKVPASVPTNDAQP